MNIMNAEGNAFQSPKDVDLGDANRLVSRICLLLPIDTDHRPWNGRIHRGHTAYLCVITAFQRSLRNSLDSILVWLSVCAKKCVASDDLGRLADSLCYSRERNAGCAVFISTFLRGAGIDDLREVFPEVVNPLKTILDAHRFWKVAHGVVRKLETQPFVTP